MAGRVPTTARQRAQRRVPSVSTSSAVRRSSRSDVCYSTDFQAASESPSATTARAAALAASTTGCGGA